MASPWAEAQSDGEMRPVGGLLGLTTRSTRALLVRSFSCSMQRAADGAWSRAPTSGRRCGKARDLGRGAATAGLERTCGSGPTEPI